MGKLLFTFLICSLFVACTRDSSTKSSLNVSVPGIIQTKSEKLAGFDTSTARLDFALLNVHSPTGTIVRRIEVKDSDPTITAAQGVSFTIDDAPTGNGQLVQFMGVYEDQTTESTVFFYGDNLANVQGGDVNVTIPATVFGGASDKEGTITGRMLSSTTPTNTGGTGPTGTLTMSFQPPGGKPAMEVIDFEMWDGWFSIFAIESSAVSFTYTLKETGEVLFDDISLSSPEFSPSALSHQVKFNKPAAFRKNNSEIDSDGEEELAVGFYAKPGTSISFSGYNVCYSTDAESVMRAFSSATATSFLQWNPSGGVAGTDITVPISSGSAQTFAAFATSTSCDPTTGKAIQVYAQKMERAEEQSIGMNGAFQEVNPYGSFSNFLELKFDTANTEIDLVWDYMPGVLENAAVSGAEIYAKFGASGSGSDGGGDDDKDCREQALEQGFQLAGISGSETFDFNGSGFAGGPVSSTNKHNWRFQVCPFRNVAGERVYSERSAQSSCIGTCSNIEHFGWAPNTDDTTVGSVITSPSNATWGGGQKRISAVDTTDPRFTKVAYSAGDSNFDASAVAGAEVVFYVTSQRTSSSCGSFNGDDLSPGQMISARLLKHDLVSDELYVYKGSAIDGVTATGDIMADTARVSNGADYCHIQAAVVPHFHNLTMNAIVASDTLTMNANNSGGGLLLFRANGTVALNGSGFTTSNRGFNAGDLGSSAAHGAGTSSGRTNTFVSGNSGGEGDINDRGGGAGFGNGGSSNGSDGGQASTNSSLPLSLHMIVGGGGASDGGVAGRGGGAIFAAIKNLSVNSSTTIEANGESGDAADESGGGGGSINLMTGTISYAAAANLTLSANGGNGNNAGDGGGGGGFVRQLACSSTSAGGVTTVSNAGGTNGGGVADDGVDGNNGSGSPTTIETGGTELFYCD